MKKYGFSLVILSLAGAAAFAQQNGSRPDPAKFQAAIQACESNKTLNPNGVTLPQPTPGQRPQFTDAQRQLLDACEQAGILPAHPHGGHHPASAEGENQEPPPAQE